MNKLLISLTAFLIVGCSSPRKHVLSTPIISMSVKSLPSKKKFKFIRKGYIRTEYCEGDKLFKNTGETIGLIDQLVLKAQIEFKANFIKDATISRISSDCYELEGTAFRIKNKNSNKKLFTIRKSHKITN